MKISQLWCLLFCLYCFQVEGEPLNYGEYESIPGELVDIGGYKLHLYCSGSGSPSIILDAGLGGSSLDWVYVQKALGSNYRVCSYDRAGYGWSEPGPAPRVTDQIVDELYTLLTKADVPPPYLLVGHSFGAYNTQYFAKLYPKQTVGLILLDPSHVEQAERIPDTPGYVPPPENSRLVTFFDTRSVTMNYPEEMWDTVAYLMTTDKTIYTQQRELSNFTASAAVLEQAGHLPDIPLTVITRGQRVWGDAPLAIAREKIWQELQKEIVAQVKQGKQVIATESGHLIHLKQPKLVVEEIKKMANQHCRLASLQKNTYEC